MKEFHYISSIRSKRTLTLDETAVLKGFCTSLSLVSTASKRVKSIYIPREGKIDLSIPYFNARALKLKHKPKRKKKLLTI